MSERSSTDSDRPQHHPGPFVHTPALSSSSTVHDLDALDPISFHHPSPSSSVDSLSISSSTPSPAPSSSSSRCSSTTVSVVDAPVSQKIIEDELQELSFTHLLLAHVGAALTLFLATTDATIVSTSLPTIVADLHASQSQYPWVGISYLLTQTAFQPLYGRFSDLLGRKNMLYSAIAIFMLGSLLCGIAKSYVALCIFRAIAGIGGGGIASSVWVITSELVRERSRAKWSQALSVTWSASAVAGPLLGGLFSDANGGHLSWRWAFLINMPIGGFASMLLFFTLRNVPLRRSNVIPWSEFWLRFDFFGLMSFMGGTTGVVLGFSFSSQYGWSSPATIAPLIGGLVLLILASVYELRTKREPLLPPSIFKNVTAGVILIISFLHNFAFNAGTFFLALYYQAVDGTSALEAGMRLLPYSLGSSLASIPAAWLISYAEKKKGTTIGQKLIVLSGLGISTIGFGLLILLKDTTPVTLQEFAPLIAGIGIGMLFHAPYQVLTKALMPDEIACATSAFFLVRFTGATCGLAVAGAVLNGRLSSSGHVNIFLSKALGSVDLRALSELQPLELRQEVLKSVTVAIQSIWMVCTPCLGLAFLLSPLIRVVPTEDTTRTIPGDSEKLSEKLSQA